MGPEEGPLSRPREPLPTLVSGLPPLPPGYHAAVDAGLRALGIELDAAARTAIDDHVRLLLAWTGAINLTAVRDPVAVGSAHVVDSLSALQLLREAGTDTLIDLGSGGGFPGLPLAIALPEARAILVESIGKKAAFLKTATAALGVEGRVAVASARAETLGADPAQRERWSVVTARAVAALDELVELAFPLLRPGGRLVAWKRGDIDRELAAARRAGTALGGAAIDLVDPRVPALPGHRLVVVHKTGRSPADYPRDPAVRRRRPW